MQVYELTDIMKNDICINLLDSNKKGVFGINNIPDIFLNKEIVELHIDTKTMNVCVDINWTNFNQKIEMENYLLLSK